VGTIYAEVPRCKVGLRVSIGARSSVRGRPARGEPGPTGPDRARPGPEAANANLRAAERAPRINDNSFCAR